jgi:hypothetical protein
MLVTLGLLGRDQKNSTYELVCEDSVISVALLLSTRQMVLYMVSIHLDEHLKRSPRPALIVARTASQRIVAHTALRLLTLSLLQTGLRPLNGQES